MTGVFMRNIIAAVCIIFAGVSSAFASGFSIYEASVRANGMLGAFAAYADHVSTIFYNPAGLSNLNGLHISAGAVLIAPRSSFRGPLPASNREFKMEEQNFIVPNFYASYGITENLTAGIAIYAPFGLGSEWPVRWPGDETSIKSELQVIFANPAVAYTLPEFGLGKVQIGAGLQVAISGSVQLSNRVRSFAVEDNLVGLEGDLKNPAVGFNAGILISPIKELTLGFTYRSSVKVEFEGDADFNNLPAAAFPAGTGISTDIELPPSWVAAVNVKILDNLTAEVDYVCFGWSTFDQLAIGFDQTVPALVSPQSPDGQQSVSDRSYNNAFQIRGGVEYSEFGVHGLTLRGGLAYDENPVPDRTLDSIIPDSDRFEFSVGASYDVTPNFAIDAAYIYVRAKQRDSQESVAGPQGVYNTFANLPSLGFTLKI